MLRVAACPVTQPAVALGVDRRQSVGVAVEEATGHRRRKQRVPARHGPDGGDEVDRRDVLQEEPAGTGAERLDDVLVGVEGRQHQHATRRRDALADELTGRLDAVEGGHADVHDDDVRAAPAGLGDALATVGRLADDLDVILAVEDHPEAGPDELLVVHEQDADAHAGTPEVVAAVADASGRWAWTRKPVGVGPVSSVPS